MTKFWMNVTSSNAWHTTPVGIIRVERELSLRIAHKPFVIDGNGFKLGDFSPRPTGMKKTRKVTSNLLQRNKAHAFLLSAQMFSQKQRFIKSIGYFISSFYGINSNLDRTIDKIVYYLYRPMRSMYTKILEIKKPLSKKTSKIPQNNIKI